MSYRPEIDGLRAIAVLAVVFFHADLGFSGGYVGVDVFFVISGFLITALIIKDLEHGAFSLAAFWERRARRILPALFVVTVVILVSAWFLLLPTDFQSLGRSASALAIFAANIHFWLDSGYFAEPSAEKPLLHTWSLAVEEQFYFVVPLVLWGAWKVVALRPRNRLVVLFSAAFGVSLVLSVLRVGSNPSSTFFLLPTRAWELLTGSVIALLPAAYSRAPLTIRQLVSVLGLGLVIWPIFFYHKNTVFPGAAALPPCIGTALVIWSNGASQTCVGKLLSLRPVVFVGLISYSLYLWHWPLFAFGTYWSIGATPLNLRLLLLVIGLLLAVLSWRFVETPFRKRQIFGSRRAILTAGVGGLAVLFALGAILMVNQGFPQRLSSEARSYADGKLDSSFIHELTTQDIAQGKLVPLGDAAAAAPTMLVWGDSHAMAAMQAFDTFLKQQHRGGRAATRSQQAPVMGFHRSDRRSRADSLEFNENVLKWLKENPVKDVVLVGYWKFYTRDTKGPTAENSPVCDPLVYSEMVEGILKTVEKIKSTGARPWILLDVPVHSFDIPQMLARSVIFKQDLSGLCAKPDDTNGLGGKDSQTIQRIIAAGAHVIDPRPAFLDPSGRFYIISTHQTSLYYDSNHLTTKGADLFLLPTLRESFAPFNQP
jgi:peptidoglycan/LPS O-acetylase OafA/YrhL